MTTNYGYWNNDAMIGTFDRKSVGSFFRSETYFLDAIDVPAMDGVLDVGCSCGRFVELLRSRGYRSHYTGVDISEPSVQICRRNYPECDFIAGNYLDFAAPRTYGLVNATGVVQHEPEYQRLIRKMLRDSSRYVLFDVKLVNTPEPVADIDRCFCQIGASRIHMVCFSFPHLTDWLLRQEDCGAVSMFGYPTPPNAETHGPAELIHQWASCGVFIDKSQPRKLVAVDLPDTIARS